MVSNVNALNGTGAVFQYDPYASNYGFDDLDIDYSMYPMSMGGSIFSGTAGMMPVTTGGTAGSNQSYFNNMKENQKFWVDYNVDQQKMQRNADLRINASVEGIKGAASNLKDKILQNEQDQIQEAFAAYINSVSTAYGNGTPSEIKSRALSLYAEMNGGKSLVQDLRENGHSSYVQGLIQSLTFGTYFRSSAEDNISQITGQPVGTGEKTMQNLGRLTGSGVIGGAAYAVAKHLCKFKKSGIIGLAAGGLAAAISFIAGKATT